MAREGLRRYGKCFFWVVILFGVAGLELAWVLLPRLEYLELWPDLKVMRKANQPPPWQLFGPATLAVLVISMAAFQRKRWRLRRSHKKTKLNELQEGHIRTLQQLAGLDDALEWRHVRTFVESIVDPRALCQRITETYRPLEHSLENHVLIEAELPESAPPVVHRRSLWSRRSTEPNRSTDTPFAVLTPRKGQLIDGFELEDGSGGVVPTRSYREYLLLVTTVMRALLYRSYATRRGAQLTHRALEAEKAALDCIASRAANDGDPGVLALRSLEQEVVSVTALELTIELTKALSTHYAIVASVSCVSGNRVVVRMKRTVVPAVVSPGGKRWRLFGRLKDTLRMALGARPVNLSVPLDLAWSAQSYHLYVHSEPGLYLGHQDPSELVDYLKKYGNPDPDSDSPPTHHRFRRRLGQEYAHFYFRYLPSPPTPDDEVPCVRFTFFEIPPGVIFRAFIASAASTVLIWMIGVLLSSARVPQPLGTDAPAFLLTFPAVAGAWLGFHEVPRRLLEGTLASRLSLIVTAACSILASGLYIAHQSKQSFALARIESGYSIVGIEFKVWSALTLVALANSLFVAYLYLVRLMTFRHLTVRGDPNGDRHTKAG